MLVKDVQLDGWFILSQTLGMLRDCVFILLHEYKKKHKQNE